MKKVYSVLGVCMMVPLCALVLGGCFILDWFGLGEKFFKYEASEVTKVNVEFLEEMVSKAYTGESDIAAYVNLFKGLEFKDYDKIYDSVLSPGKPGYTSPGRSSQRLTFTLGTGKTIIYWVYSNGDVIGGEAAANKTRVAKIATDSFVFRNRLSSSQLLPTTGGVLQVSYYNETGTRITTSLSDAKREEIMELLYGKTLTYVEPATIYPTSAAGLRYELSFLLAGPTVKPLLYIAPDLSVYTYNSSYTTTHKYRKLAWEVSTQDIIAIIQAP